MANRGYGWPLALSREVDFHFPPVLGDWSPVSPVVLLSGITCRSHTALGYTEPKTFPADGAGSRKDHSHRQGCHHVRRSNDFRKRNSSTEFFIRVSEDDSLRDSRHDVHERQQGVWRYLLKFLSFHVLLSSCVR